MTSPALAGPLAAGTLTAGPLVATVVAVVVAGALAVGTRGAGPCGAGCALLGHACLAKVPRCGGASGGEALGCCLSSFITLASSALRRSLSRVRAFASRTRRLGSPKQAGYGAECALLGPELPEEAERLGRVCTAVNLASTDKCKTAAWRAVRVVRV